MQSLEVIVENSILHLNTSTILFKKKIGANKDAGKDQEPLELDFSTLTSKNSMILGEQKLATSEVRASKSYIDESESTSTSFLKASTVDTIVFLLQSPMA